MPNVRPPYYTERYAQGWSIWESASDTNDGYVYPSFVEATEMCAVYTTSPSLFAASRDAAD
jgi:hypothetical protein